MFFWIHKKDSEGKKHWWAIDVEPMFILMVVGLLLALLGPTVLLSMPFLLLVIGFVLLTISKISVFKKGVWFSFGTALMTKGNARLYKLAYILMGVGFLLSMFLFLGTS